MDTTMVIVTTLIMAGIITPHHLIMPHLHVIMLHHAGGNGLVMHTVTSINTEYAANPLKILDIFFDFR